MSVDYFPHKVSHGRTIFILEEKFGNDGYAILFKTLEILSGAEGHFYDFSGEENFLYLCARFKAAPEIVKAALEMMSKLGFLDAELYGKSILWCDHLVTNLCRLYTKRAEEVPVKPIAAPVMPIAAPVLPPSKAKHSIEKQSIENILVHFAQFWSAYPKKKNKGQAEKTWKRISPDQDLFSIILAGVERAIKSFDWKKDNGKYIPHPSTWLNARGWEDEENIIQPPPDEAEKTRRALEKAYGESSTT